MAKNEKICIIGAGPAGLSAAVHLEKNGYTDYAILEREDHVGGKCHSPYHDGKRFEMGAIMGCPTYYAVHELELFGGVDHNGPKLERAYRKQNGKPYDPFNPKKNPLLIPHLLRMKSQVKKLGTLLATKYKDTNTPDTREFPKVNTTDTIPSRANMSLVKTQILKTFA